MPKIPPKKTDKDLKREFREVKQLRAEILKLAELAEEVKTAIARATSQLAELSSRLLIVGSDDDIPF